MEEFQTCHWITPQGEHVMQNVLVVVLTEIFPQPAEITTFKASRNAKEEKASRAHRTSPARDEERKKKKKKTLERTTFLRHPSLQVTCEDGCCTPFVPCPVHLVVFGLKPAAYSGVVEITTRVIFAVNFIRAIPAVTGEVAELIPRNACHATSAVRWTMKMSF